MNLKLKVETTIRMKDVEETNIDDLRNRVREHFKEGKYSFNNISFKIDYTDEEKCI